MPPKSDLWKHVLDRGSDSSGNHDMQCLYCEADFSGGASRILHHLAGTGGGAGISPCSQVPEELKKQCQTKLEKDALTKQRKQKLDALGRSSSAPELEVVGPAPKKKKDGDMRSLFSRDAKHKVDRAVARFFYGTGTSFNRLSSPYFDEMLAAVALHGPGYKKPSMHAIRGALLQEKRAGLTCWNKADGKPDAMLGRPLLHICAYLQRSQAYFCLADVETRLQETFMANLPMTGCTLGSDGWSSTDSRPLLNILLVTPGGACFDRSIDTSGQTKARSLLLSSKLRVRFAVAVLELQKSCCFVAGRALRCRHYCQLH